MKAPDKIYVASGTTGIGGLCGLWFADMESDLPQYIRKDALLEWVKLAYGKVSMNPFDCSEAFEELINKIDAL